MRNNSVKVGLFDQRNRATQSRRKRRYPIQDEPAHELEAWLDCNVVEDSKLGQINLAEFLVETQHIDVDPAERLRQLAISLELSASSMPGQSGWEALKRIYDYALQLNDRDEHVWLSMGISAQEIAEHQSNDLLKSKLYKHKEFAVLEALKISPSWSRAHYSLGYLYYFQDNKNDALQEFELTLNCENDNKVHSWAQLYKGHCFHDENNWKQALEAYSLVDLSAFSGNTSWRVDVLREQISECTLRSGEKESAEKMLVKILNRYEAEPALARYALSVSFWNVAESLSPYYVEKAKGIEIKAWKTL